MSEYSDASTVDQNHDLGINDIGIDDTNFGDIPSFVTPSDHPMQNGNSINYYSHNRMPVPEQFRAEADEHDHRIYSPAVRMWSAQQLNAVDTFLLGLGATICTFPAIEIAKLKLELSNIVFNNELELAEARAHSN